MKKDFEEDDRELRHLAYTQTFERDRLMKSKLTLNKNRVMPVDIVQEQSSTSKFHLLIKCSIVKLSVKEQVDFFIFKTKNLVFTVNTKQVAKDNSTKKNWTVKRFESDFYTLRNILILSYG